MGTRIELHNKLLAILGDNPHAYFQPPETIKLQYPCIVYKLSNNNAHHADDKVYMSRKVYDLTYITKDPDDDFIDTMIENFNYVRFDRSFTADNLNHYAFKLFY